MFTKYTHRILILAFVSLSLVSCGGGSGSASTSPGTETTTTRSGGGSGGSVPTGNKSLTVSWNVPTKNSDGSKLTDLSGYKIYYGISANSLIESIPVGLGYTTFTINKLASNTKYYFAITAVNSKSVESFLSNTVNKTTAS